MGTLIDIVDKSFVKMTFWCFFSENIIKINTITSFIYREMLWHIKLCYSDLVSLIVHGFDNVKNGDHDKEIN